MAARPYQQTRRAENVGATRQRIVAAALDQLVGGERFSIDAVARRAGVTRATVYSQFGGGDELREAVYDHLAETGGLTALPAAFSAANAADGLRILIEIFCGFYATHRTALRRLNALSMLADDEHDRHHGRNERRRC